MVARRRREMAAEQSLGQASDARPELEDGLCFVQRRVANQLVDGVILVEPLRVELPTDPVVDGLGCSVTQHDVGSSGHGVRAGTSR